MLGFWGVGDPKNVVVFLCIEATDVSGNDAVFVTGRIFEGQFALDCDSTALGIKGGQVVANVVFGLGLGDVSPSFAVTIDEVCPTKALAGDPDLLERKIVFET